MKKTKLLREEFKNTVVNLLHEQKDRPLTERQIAEKLSVRGGDRKRLGKLLDVMVKEGLIVCVHKNQYGMGSPADLVTGELTMRRSGVGIVFPKDGAEEVFIPQDSLSTSLAHDLVVVRLSSDPDERGRRTGKIIRILERARRAIVGTLRATGKFFYVVPIDPVYIRNFYVTDLKGARVNDRVVIQCTAWDNRHVNPEAEIMEVIGPESNPSYDTLVITRHYSLPDKFPAEVMREAGDAARLLDQPGERHDLRDRFIFTIDPATARDYDDAISLETDENNRRILGVHIADVSHFVRVGSALDCEARERGNSVYFPDLVLPMLPETISNGVCSLRPDEDRFAFSVMITFNSAGVPVSTEFHRSIIRSRLRLTYEQALKVLNSGAGQSCADENVSHHIF
ncbi:RNB domain-containing ribonuclease [Verrucomicrobiota bacterium]